jgi:hypothetical protein
MSESLVNTDVVFKVTEMRGIGSLKEERKTTRIFVGENNKH